MPTPSLMLHPDRLFPAEPQARAVARRLYDSVATLPIISPHGHVDARVLADNRPFADPVSLLISPDHYVTRLLHADGASLADLGVGEGPLPEAQARAAWRLLCERWSVFRGTPVRYWFESELADIFGVTQRPGPDSADASYDRIASALAQPEFLPRNLLQRFRIDVLATTDDPCDDLAAHRTLAADPSVATRVVPTFRPDRYLEPAGVGFVQAVRGLGQAAGMDTGDYAGYVAALEERRRFFVANGAVSADHSHLDVGTEPLSPAQATGIYARSLAGQATASEATAFRRHMLGEMARMSCEDGLVMTLHPAVYRNHHAATFDRYGPDTGHDIPVAAEFTRALRPLLARYGTAAGFHLVLFTVDETVFSREIAPLAGFYPAVYAGAPWWFLDAPDAIGRYRSAITETAGFTRTSGFVDDTRAFCSIPARHDMARRLDAAYLARMVTEHRLEEAEAAETIVALAADNPRKVFKL